MKKINCINLQDSEEILVILQPAFETKKYIHDKIQ